MGSASDSGRSQSDFDREVGLIYSAYGNLLDRNHLTENDADRLAALGILRGQMQLPWLANIKLLVLDGFFDFTPVQGDILRSLIPQIPETLVNLNYDDRNPEIFVPFEETISQLCAMASFETKRKLRTSRHLVRCLVCANDFLIRSYRIVGAGNSGAARRAERIGIQVFRVRRSRYRNPLDRSRD